MKLHLGCGKRVIPGFVHIDLADFPHIDHRHDVRTLPMIADGVADLVYASHILEYFDREEVKPVLAEWRRALKQGGTLRVAVPDFEALFDVYRETGDLDRITGPLYGRWPVNGTDRVLHHRTTYDFRSLANVLTTAGFTDIRRFDWRRTEHADVDDYSQSYIPHMDKERGRLISLNVEATKAGAA
jgi:predicted SAM-dependent methyltransferase